jgi:hypothetical protein
MAPKFNVISKPNDWTKSVQEQAAAAQAGPLTESQARHLKFWTQFREYLEESKSSVITNQPSKNSWTIVSVGRSEFALSLANNFRDGWSAVSLTFYGPRAKAHYALLEQRHRAEVDARLQTLGDLRWEPKPNAQESAVTLFRRVSPADPATWPALNIWMAQALVAMQILFRPIVSTLNADEYQPEPAANGEPEAFIPDLLT